MEKLRAVYDSRKEFYGKAKTFSEDGALVLRSYSTDVAFIKDGSAYVRGTYSNTTLRHIKEFLIQNGFKAETSKQIVKDYDANRPGAEKVEAPDPLASHQKSVGLVCALGKVLCSDNKEKNSFDKRIVGTLPGIDFPEDWDQLPEEEKRRRLDGALAQIS